MLSRDLSPGHVLFALLWAAWNALFLPATGVRVLALATGGQRHETEVTHAAIVAIEQVEGAIHTLVLSKRLGDVNPPLEVERCHRGVLSQRQVDTIVIELVVELDPLKIHEAPNVVAQNIGDTDGRMREREREREREINGGLG